MKRIPFLYSLFFGLIILNAISGKSVSAQQVVPPGVKVYQKLCLECHGQEGAGVESVYPQPLIGDLSVKELAD